MPSPSQPESGFSAVLHVLAELRANPEQSRVVIDAYQNRHAATQRSDPGFPIVLQILAELGASPEQSQAVIEAYRNPPSATREAPASEPPTSPNTSHEPPKHVSLGKKNMSKSKIPLSLNQKGHLHIYGSVWYGLFRRPQRVEGGAIKLRLKKVRLGPISQMSREEAERELRQIISRVRTLVAPSDGMTVREF